MKDESRREVGVHPS